MAKNYVVYCCEHLRDGIEEGAKIVSTLDEAVEVLDRWGNGFAACNTDFRLFELGPEVPITRGVIETPQPDKEQTKFALGKGPNRRGPRHARP